MYHTATRVWCQAVGPRVDRGVRPHSVANNRCMRLLEARSSRLRSRIVGLSGHSSSHKLFDDLAERVVHHEGRIEVLNLGNAAVRAKHPLAPLWSMSHFS
jgi:hypothetical protein